MARRKWKWIDIDIISEKNIDKTGRPGRPETTVYEVNETAKGMYEWT